MNRLMVKPIPQRTATPVICVQFARARSCAHRSFTKLATTARTPISFPANSPAATPSVCGSTKVARDVPAMRR